MSEHQQPPKEHCEHEVVCMWYRNDSVLASIDGTRCMRNQEGCKECAQDTRSRPHPAPAERLGFTEFCHVHCDKHECCTNECERSAYEADRKAREDVLDAIVEWLNSDDHLSLYKWEVREKTRALRSTKQQAGDQHE